MSKIEPNRGERKAMQITIMARKCVRVGQYALADGEGRRRTVKKELIVELLLTVPSHDVSLDSPGVAFNQRARLKATKAGRLLICG